MLDYSTNIMEDAQDFGLASAKGAHALIVCCMEDGNVNWLMSDRHRRAYAQKIVANPAGTQLPKGKGDQGVVL